MTTSRMLAAFMFINRQRDTLSVRIDRDACENISIVSKRNCLTRTTNFSKASPRMRVQSFDGAQSEPREIREGKFQAARDRAGLATSGHGTVRVRRPAQTKRAAGPGFSRRGLWLARHSRPWGKLPPKRGLSPKAAPSKGWKRRAMASLILQVWQVVDSDLDTLSAAVPHAGASRVPLSP